MSSVLLSGDRKKSVVLCGLLIVAARTVVGASLVDAVDPMIGAVTYPEHEINNVHGFGKTFPGATTPFGMVQLSPDTITGGDNGSGYSYSHKTIEGFSLMHMSGIGWYGSSGTSRSCRLSAHGSLTGRRPVRRFRTSRRLQRPAIIRLTCCVMGSAWS